MIVTEVVPRSLAATDVAPDAGREWLAGIYRLPDGPYVRLNMVTSLTGSAAGPDGTSESLTSRVDRAILGVIRRDADVVLVGAQSVRAEGYVVPRSTRLAIVTTTGDITGHRLDAAGGTPGRVLFVCPAVRASMVAARAEPMGAAVVPVDAAGDRMEPAAILAALAARGMARVVCEGGPSLATQFTAAGVIDEYCVTVAPLLEPADTAFVTVDAASRPDTEVVGMLVDEAGFSYLRLRRPG